MSSSTDARGTDVQGTETQDVNAQGRDAAAQAQPEEKQGTTRKSAASAKPATQAAASVYVPRNAPKKKEPKKPFENLKTKLEKNNKPKTKAEKRAAQEARELRQFQDAARDHVPNTVKYRRLRFLFWATILLAIAFTLYALLLIATQGPAEGRIWFGIGSILVAVAIYIDTSKVRQEREEDYQRILDEQKNRKKKPAGASHAGAGADAGASSVDAGAESAAATTAASAASEGSARADTDADADTSAGDDQSSNL